VRTRGGDTRRTKTKKIGKGRVEGGGPHTARAAGAIVWKVLRGNSARKRIGAGACPKSQNANGKADTKGERAGYLSWWSGRLEGRTGKGENNSGAKPLVRENGEIF